MLTRVFSILILLLFASLLLHGQTPPPGSNSSDGAPIDGLSGLLLVAGIGYGAKRILESKDSNN